MPGGRQARTVRSGSERARLSAAPVPSSSDSRSRAALRTRAMPLRSARPTSWRRCQVPPARRRHQAGRAAARHGGGAASLRRVPAGRRAAQDRSAAPGSAAHRRSGGSTRRSSRAVISSVIFTVRVVANGGVELHPLLGYPGEREHGNDLIAEQRLGQLVEVRTGQHAAALDRGDQLGGDPVPAVARAQQQRDQRAGEGAAAVDPAEQADGLLVASARTPSPRGAEQQPAQPIGIPGFG